MKEEENIEVCFVCGDDIEDYPNNGFAHYDCARDYEIYEESQQNDLSE